MESCTAIQPRNKERRSSQIPSKSTKASSAEQSGLLSASKRPWLLLHDFASVYQPWASRDTVGMFTGRWQPGSARKKSWSGDSTKEYMEYSIAGDDVRSQETSSVACVGESRSPAKAEARHHRQIACAV